MPRGYPCQRSDWPRDLTTAIRIYINGWNNRAHPFGWTKTADEILKKANRQTTSNAGH
jgi:hypothetical protein